MENKSSNSEFNLTEKEREKALQFNQQVITEFKKVDPQERRKEYYTDFDNTTRFLIARDYKEKKAMEMWTKWY